MKWSSLSIMGECCADELLMCRRGNQGWVELTMGHRPADAGFPGTPSVVNRGTQRLEMLEGKRGVPDALLFVSSHPAQT